ncbi:MAG: phosphoribosylformylglycinamidine synthase subunit PurL [Myxococcales bacterium]|nr:MAG: phosphoribosylformylglycinamidine synthase subunit PurL [Myxococcales bacterium]
MPIRIEVIHKPGVPDAAGESLRRRLKADLGLDLARVRVSDVYTLDATLSAEQIETCRARLFTDPITQDSAVNRPAALDFGVAVEVGFLPGVTDNVGKTSREAVQDLLGVALAPGEAVYSSRRYLFEPAIEGRDLDRVIGLLANPLIHRVRVETRRDAAAAGTPPVPKVTLAPNPRVDRIDLDVPDEELKKLGGQGVLDRVEAGREIRRGPLALDLDSLHVIRDYFAREGRQPTDVELEALAQTWSEHCKHTIFAAQLDDVDSLYKSMIRRATEDIRRALGPDDWCVSVFSDNSGVIRFDGGFNVCYKVETHNSPSALDPYGGAITGIVGVNRDPLGTGMGAKLVANMYGFCFGNPFFKGELPYRKPDRREPILHPKAIFEGVRQGVEHGGNKSGIPTSWGFLSFDDRYMGKPLVFVGTLGLMPAELHGRPSHEKSALAGDWIVMAGGRVGADGIHGATFSSESLHAGSPTGAVQIGDPITQKKLADAQLEARDLGLYRSVTDNGAGGLSCSVCEMARESGGCEVELDKVPIKYAGLAPNEIWISESQERMTYAVAPETLDAFLDLMRRRDVEATVIGRFTANGRAVVRFGGERVMDVDLHFLHDGLPKRNLRSAWTPPLHPEPARPAAPDVAADVLGLLSQLNVCSKEYVVRQYDHEVQGGSVVKPLIGVDLDVHSDATVLKPVLDLKSGIALSSALYPSYGDIDPYAMAAAAIDTALRNQIAVGADPSRIALLDNFCWCSSNEPERLGQLKRTAQACYDLAVAYRAPFVSGKDSMFNDFKGYDAAGKSVCISVPPTILISSVGFIPDVRRAVTLDAKAAGDFVYVAGWTRDELGGSEYYRLLGERTEGKPFVGRKVPQVDVDPNRRLYAAVAQAIREGLVASAASVHLGGLAAALAKTAMAGGLGLDVDLDRLPAQGAPDLIARLFSESQGRLVLTVWPKHAAAFEALFAGLPMARVGEATAEPVLFLRQGKRPVAGLHVAEMKRAYKQTLDW